MSTGGSPEEGRVEIRRFGCGACHTIGGVPGANGKVGPELNGVAGRAYIAGVVENSPQNIVSWIMNPKAHSPTTAMPYLGVSESQARDIAAYLYSLPD